MRYEVEEFKERTVISQDANGIPVAASPIVAIYRIILILYLEVYHVVI